MAVTQLKDGRWQAYYRNPSAEGPSLIREYFGRGAAAQIKAEARNRELALNRTRPKSAPDTGPSLSDLAEEYVAGGRFNANSEQLLRIRLTSRILPFLGEITALSLTHADIDRYVLSRKKTVKDSTIRREIVDIKAILNWSVKRRPQLIPFNPIRDYVAPKSDDAVIMPPSSAEMAAILKHASERLLRAIRISWFTGLRPGAVELLSLTWSSVLWDRGVIRVQSAHKGGPALRDVPIHPGLLSDLAAWWDKDGKGFGPIIHCDGHPIKSLKNAWRWALKKSGITRRIRMYDLRHDFVTSAIESGVDYKTLSEIVGSNPETLRKYYQHVSSASKINAISVIRSAGDTGDNLGTFKK